MAGPRSAAIVGQLLVTAVLVRMTLSMPHDSFGAFFLALAFLVGVPLSMPWLTLSLSEMAFGERPLSAVEVPFYAVFMLCEVGVFVFFPKLASESEGFAALYLWPIGGLMSLVVILLSGHGRRLAALKNEDAR